MSPDGSKIVYSDDDSITVVDVSTGETSTSPMAAWVDDGTLVVASGGTLGADG